MNITKTAAVGLALLGATAITSCKKGCTDPDAVNYEEKAKKDDGSCEYDTVTPPSSNEITITDNGSGTGTTTWTSDKVYILDGMVFVNSGQTLTIEPGTVIKGMSGQGANASALIVAKGGTINACGTATEPIIFTSVDDELNGNLALNTRGLWGGLIILGDASLNSSPGQTQIEGIPTTETRGLYGGSNDADNSGSLCYVSIRHGGSDIGAGNEINGLTLGGVGSGTSMNHIEIVANNDDGVEFFGGTASIKNLVVSYCGDDAIDYDEGWRGNVQFALVVQDANAGDRIGEHDGGTTPETGAPFATPEFQNVTYIGRGIGAGKRMLTFRDNAGGSYNNSIFLMQDKGIDIENLASGEDSYSRFSGGDLTIANNIFYDVAVAGTGATASDLFKISMGSGWPTPTDSTNELTASTTAFQASFASNGNTVADPGVTAANPVPTGSVSGAVASSNTWFDAVSYKGAFDPAASNWASWTRLFE